MPCSTRAHAPAHMQAGSLVQGGCPERHSHAAAGFNQISRVPDELAHCRLLRVLDLRNNKVPAFPDACCTLELNLLDLTNNSIRRGCHMGAGAAVVHSIDTGDSDGCLAPVQAPG